MRYRTQNFKRVFLKTMFPEVVATIPQDVFNTYVTIVVIRIMLKRFHLPLQLCKSGKSREKSKLDFQSAATFPISIISLLLLVTAEFILIKNHFELFISNKQKENLNPSNASLRNILLRSV